MFLDIAIVVVLVICAYELGLVRGQRKESRWWTGAIYAAGRGRLDALQAYIAARNPRVPDPHQCPEELAPHLVLPYVGDRGAAIVLPADWATAVGEATTKPVNQAATNAADALRKSPRDVVTIAGSAERREKAG
jgi:hypothetical protein